MQQRLEPFFRNGYKLQQYMANWITQEGKVELDWRIVISFQKELKYF